MVTPLALGHEVSVCEMPLFLLQRGKEVPAVEDDTTEVTQRGALST